METRTFSSQMNRFFSEIPNADLQVLAQEADKEAEFDAAMQIAMQCARGRFQRQILCGIHTLGPKTWTRKMLQFKTQYDRSIQNLLRRLDENGVVYEVTPGKWGGRWSSRLVIKSLKNL